MAAYRPMQLGLGRTCTRLTQDSGMPDGVSKAGQQRVRQARRQRQQATRIRRLLRRRAQQQHVRREQAACARWQARRTVY